MTETQKSTGVCRKLGVKYAEEMIRHGFLGNMNETSSTNLLEFHRIYQDHFLFSLRPYNVQCISILNAYLWNLLTAILPPIIPVLQTWMEKFFNKGFHVPGLVPIKFIKSNLSQILPCLGFPKYSDTFHGTKPRSAYTTANAFLGDWSGAAASAVSFCRGSKQSEEEVEAMGHRKMKGNTSPRGHWCFGWWFGDFPEFNHEFGWFWPGWMEVVGCLQIVGVVFFAGDCQLFIIVGLGWWFGFLESPYEGDCY